MNHIFIEKTKDFHCNNLKKMDDIEILHSDTEILKETENSLYELKIQ